MRRPVAKVRRQTFLALRFGAEFEELLLPQEIERKRRGDGVSKLMGRDSVEILGHTSEEKGMAGFIKLDELTGDRRGYNVVDVFQVVDMTLKQGIVREEFNNTERFAANGDDIHAAVFVMLDDFQDFHRAADANDAVWKGQQHAEGRFRVEAFADHLAVARLKNVKRELFAWEKHDVQGKERNAIRLQVSHAA
jgi:hypothetical protein